MPVPVLVGLPWLASLLGGFFASLFSFFATYVTKRVAIVAAAVIIIGTLTVGLFTALELLVDALTFVLPAEFTGMAGHFVPPIAPACVTAHTTARLLRFAYDWNVRVIQYKLL